MGRRRGAIDRFSGRRHHWRCGWSDGLRHRTETVGRSGWRDGCRRRGDDVWMGRQDTFHGPSDGREIRFLKLKLSHWSYCQANPSANVRKCSLLNPYIETARMNLIKSLLFEEIFNKSGKHTRNNRNGKTIRNRRVRFSHGSTERGNKASLVESDLTVDGQRVWVIMHASTNAYLWVVNRFANQRSRSLESLGLMKSTRATSDRVPTQRDERKCWHTMPITGRDKRGVSTPAATAGRHRYSRRNKPGIIRSQLINY